MRKIPRTPLLFIILGFMGGVIISRNAEPMGAPSKGSILLCMLVGGFVLWRAGYKGKAEAVATAVAIATATAEANAEAHAQAIAQQAVSVYIGAQREHEEIYGESLKFLDGVADTSSISNTATTKEIENDDAGYLHHQGRTAGNGNPDRAQRGKPRVRQRSR